MEIFGQRLKELREEKSLSQRQFAEIMGISQPNLQRWEKVNLSQTKKPLLLLQIILKFQETFFSAKKIE